MPSELDLLKTAIEAAQSAGTVLRGLMDKPRQITTKGYLDIFTDADLAADSAVQTVIRRHHPDHFILSEESDIGKAVAEWQPPNDVYWIIDPIDGTTNFSRGLPNWCIAIGAAQGETLMAGVIYDVVRDHLFSAARGHGATLNGQAMGVNKTTALEWALCGVDWPVAPEKRRRMLNYAERLGLRVRSLRSAGTSALGLAHVAAGFMDCYIHLSLKPWDSVAGALLIQEAGGQVTSIDGSPWQLRDQTIFASAGPLHEALLNLLHG